MFIQFTEEQLTSARYFASGDAITRCLQCGYCLSSCPTYELLGDERDSPKGRVALIKSMLESEAPPDESTVTHIDRCMSCLACMSSCPSFVNYMRLVDHARAHIEEHYRRPAAERLTRWALARILPKPQRLRLAIKGAHMARPLAKFMPGTMRRMVELAPAELPPPAAHEKPQVLPAIGERIMRVALLTGCAQPVLNPAINQATINILRRHGCEVVIPNGAGCCGALTHHMGRSADSLAAAANNVRAWMHEVRGEGLDAIVINTSGCGTVVKDYAHMLADHELADDAARIAALAKDIAEVLDDLELQYRLKPGLRVVYHATCSLQFGQRIRYLPKKLLKAAGFSVLEPRDSNMCCGSAATYHLLQPEISTQLQSRKVHALEETSADVVVAGNIGCMVHIGSATSMPVVHTVELLDWVTGGEQPAGLTTID